MNIDRILKDKVALVTGASKGIGAGIALELARAGANVVINYATSPKDADKVAEQVRALDVKCMTVKADISKKDQVSEMFRAGIAAFGRIDILVNNAGVYDYPLIAGVTEDGYRKMFDINVLGPLLTTQEAVKYMEQSGGSIINISSLAARKTVQGASLYAATKAALNEITKVTAQELGSKGIRVNAILPGYVDTEGARAMGEAAELWAKQLVAATPLGRGGLPSDIGKVAVFLASASSFWITGELIAVSGGLL
ncbi:SDR family NAD(P)-dependent oxidoreductase [Mucilaginibacter sp. 22184]|uniref:SDR family NAD(P)-dependent oxidoreductase n=1 Tax=Mucilaginibacter sp. 22184 TaxID=3453887 RepID=UPI003F856051